MLSAAAAILQSWGKGDANHRVVYAKLFQTSPAYLMVAKSYLLISKTWIPVTVFEDCDPRGFTVIWA